MGSFTRAHVVLCSAWASVWPAYSRKISIRALDRSSARAVQTDEASVTARRPDIHVHFARSALECGAPTCAQARCK